MNKISAKEIYSETIGFFLQPVASLMNDAEVSEVMINGIGPGSVYFEKAGIIHAASDDICFDDEASLMAAAQNIAEYVGRRLDDTSHSMDGRLPQGHRVHVIVPPASKDGITMTIRKFRDSRMTLDDLIGFKSLTKDAAGYLRKCVRSKQNIVISGGTGTGKTSMLNALSACIKPNERIVVIEDTSELRLAQPHTIYLEAQPPKPDGEGEISIRDLFVDSLRMRPDRIIVGEVRRGEALDLIQSMISGHAGSLTTVHANSARDAAIRLETLCLMSDVELPQIVARMQVASAINVVVQLKRYDNGDRKVHSISEAHTDLTDNKYAFEDIFQRKLDGEELPLELARLHES